MIPKPQKWQNARFLYDGWNLRTSLWLYQSNCSHRFVVQPEWHPWHHDNHESRNVVGDDVEGQLPLEYHVNSQATVLSWQQRKLGEILGSTSHLKCSNWHWYGPIIRLSGYVWGVFSIHVSRMGKGIPSKVYDQNGLDFSFCSFSPVAVFTLQ